MVVSDGYSYSSSMESMARHASDVCCLTVDGGIVAASVKSGDAPARPPRTGPRIRFSSVEVAVPLQDRRHNLVSSSTTDAMDESRRRSAVNCEVSDFKCRSLRRRVSGCGFVELLHRWSAAFSLAAGEICHIVVLDNARDVGPMTLEGTRSSYLVVIAVIVL